MGFVRLGTAAHQNALGCQSDPKGALIIESTYTYQTMLFCSKGKLNQVNGTGRKKGANVSARVRW